MFVYVLKRIGAAVLTLLLIMSITFFLMNAIPGSPFLTEKSTPQQIELANQKYGLDKPLVVQLKNYILNYLKGDLGVSLKMQEGTDVSKLLFHQGKFELSIKLGISAILLAIVIGIPLGCIAAYNRGSWIDGFLRVMTTVGVAIPTFVLATLLLIYFGVKHPVLPTNSGSLTDFKSMIMPIISLSFYYVCYIAKLTRTSMLDAINQDYIRTARAKGVKTRWIVLKHALRNSLIPVVTYLGPVTAGIITGSFVVESTFQIPGLGKYFVNSILSRDYPVIMATTVVLAALVIFMNLVVDIVYKMIDPRITLTNKEG
ncbi:MAG: ABC transporter permease [Firmicutes bacterium]|nr:ABC transporter permease [Bacillota bacterium]MBR6352320.1 ABC transporter permease [Bacillota bacterium]